MSVSQGRRRTGRTAQIQIALDPRPQVSAQGHPGEGALASSRALRKPHVRSFGARGAIKDLSRQAAKLKMLVQVAVGA
jgi:hypothetical protein